ncbi:MAG: hypothetical protein BAJALOKI3v1_480020 [Promethearchaeota archaeon]|nr:MAG: hypothetical protein BAJALOKI3v1_480020 [Candidatus Lokiarchaeota archaeon]
MKKLSFHIIGSNMYDSYKEEKKVKLILHFIHLIRIKKKHSGDYY